MWVDIRGVQCPSQYKRCTMSQSMLYQLERDVQCLSRYFETKREQGNVPEICECFLNALTVEVLNNSPYLR